MRSIGIDLMPHVKKGLLQVQVARPTLYGLEMHLVTMYDLIDEFKPSVVVLDPITDFTVVGTLPEVKAAITRIIDYLRTNQITGLFTSFTSGDNDPDQFILRISSLIDASISLRNLESNGEHHRGLFVLKSRGMSHSNQIRSLILSDDGIRLGEMDLAGR
jgi:circadian clock protein KaiC